MKLLFQLLMLLFFTSCANQTDKPLVLSVDTWIGASPLYYAHSKGWLKEANIEMLLAPSIDENLRMFESGASDIFTGTEHEYMRESKLYPDLVPFIIYDRSFGGDVILANRTPAELKENEEHIQVYLETNTINEDMLRYWIRFNNIPSERIVINHRSQDEIAKLTAVDHKTPVLAITYNPNNVELEKNGFIEIASSKDERYLIIDGIYTSAKVYTEHRLQLEKLNEALKRAVDVYKKEPKAFYNVVKSYVGNPSYEEFLSMQGNIKWLLGEPSDSLLEGMKELNIPVKDLLR